MATIVQQTNGEKTIYTADEYTQVQQKFNDIYNTQLPSKANQTDMTSVNAQLADMVTDVLHPPAPLVAAKGDGTTDDTQAIQNIINGMTNGGVVLLPALFKITSINLKSNILLMGTGQDKSGFISTSSTIISVPNGSVRWGISNLGIQGAPATSTAIDLIGSSGGIADFSLRDIYIYNCLNGFRSSYSWGFVFDRVRFQNVKNALVLNAQTNQGVFNGCSFRVTSRVASFSNANSISFNGCELGGNNHDGTVPLYYYQSVGISFNNCYVETFASNIPLATIGSLSSVSNKAIGFHDNYISWSTTGHLFDVYTCDGLDVSNNNISSGVAYLLKDNIGNIKNLNMESNSNYTLSKPSENVMKNHDFFAWGSGTSAMPTGFSAVTSATASRNATDGSLELVTTGGYDGVLTSNDLMLGGYLSSLIEVKSSVNNTLYIEGLIDGAYVTLSSLSLTAGTYTLVNFFHHVIGAELTYFRLRFSAAGTHNIKRFLVYQGIFNVDKDSRPRRLSTIAPTHGSFIARDIVEHSNPSASGNMGWVCVTKGSPGTWKTYGNIGA